MRRALPGAGGLRHLLSETGVEVPAFKQRDLSGFQFSRRVKVFVRELMSYSSVIKVNGEAGQAFAAN